MQGSYVKNELSEKLLYSRSFPSYAFGVEMDYENFDNLYDDEDKDDDKDEEKRDASEDPLEPEDVRNLMEYASRLWDEVVKTQSPQETNKLNSEYSNTSYIIAQNALNEYELLLGIYLNVLRREFPIDSSIKKTSAIYRDESEGTDDLQELRKSADVDKATIEKNMAALSSQGLRVWDFATRYVDCECDDPEKVESNLTFQSQKN
ncbi:hypothetical protein FOB60_002508, partial [Candida parapsilosis]